MNQQQKALLRAALQIHDRLRLRQSQNTCELPYWHWKRLEKLHRQIQKARRRDWRVAVRQLTRELLPAIQLAREDLLRFWTEAKGQDSEQSLLRECDVYRDLLALDTEFEAVSWDAKTAELSVQTDAIELENVYLGRFEIKLGLAGRGATKRYRVIALDPHPAATSEGVTHPHVQDESLCEGEGRAAIRAALEEGRLLDFFLVVSQVLHTYGKGSAYVELAKWTGEACHDCGGTTCEGERYFCTHCDAILCDECSVTCAGCDNGFCANCRSACSFCQQEFCSSCREKCSECSTSVCSDCLQDDLCPKCYEERNNESELAEPSADANRPAGERGPDADESFQRVPEGDVERALVAAV